MLNMKIMRAITKMPEPEFSVVCFMSAMAN
jgi:hypothetical protein